MFNAHNRSAKILGDIDVRRSKGLEIGPLTCPIVRPSDGEIFYVDYTTTDELRKKPYLPGINPAEIVDVDIVWGDQPLAECVPAGKKFDYVIASHVIEHVPDLIGWLLDLHSVLKPGGTVGLAIPDKRYSFDIAKNESTLGEMVEAYLHRYRKPSVRQQFDHCWQARHVTADEAWAGNLVPNELPKFSDPYSLMLAWHQAQKQVAKGLYYDSHCWMFTPTMFAETAKSLSALGLFPFVIEFIEPTHPGTFEFFVRLKTVPSEGAGKITIDEAMYAYLAGPVSQTVPASEVADLRHVIETKTQKLSAIENSRIFRAHQAVRKLFGLPHFS